MTKYPQEIREFIFANYKGIGPKEMSKIIFEKFGYEMPHKNVKSFYQNNKLNSGLDGRFKPGHTPWLKGKHITFPGSEKTQFKKGNRPKNVLEVGTQILKSDGYLWEKIAEPNKWKQVHKMLWEEAYGEIPAGNVIIFLDGNAQNITLDNLALVSREEHLILTRHKLRSPSKDITGAGVNTAKLIAAINKKKKEKRL